MDDQLILQQLAYNFECLAVSKVAQPKDNLEWHKLMISHSQFNWYEGP